MAMMSVQEARGRGSMLLTVNVTTASQPISKAVDGKAASYILYRGWRSKGHPAVNITAG